MPIQYQSEQPPDVAAMNAPLPPAILRAAAPDLSPAAPLPAQGVQRYVWDSRFGAMLIEVKDGEAYVNGQRVEAFTAATRDRE
jgi:hypothetical protein